MRLRGALENDEEPYDRTILQYGISFAQLRSAGKDPLCDRVYPALPAGPERAFVCAFDGGVSRGTLALARTLAPYAEGYARADDIPLCLLRYQSVYDLRGDGGGSRRAHGDEGGTDQDRICALEIAFAAPFLVASDVHHEADGALRRL